MKVRAVLVEDEPFAMRTLREFVAEVDWIDAIGEAANGLTAVELIDTLRPDLAFLDVKMPELSGLQVLERVKHHPAIVFTTAFDRYAVAAFELEAIDYLVKPFGRKRFHATLERVHRRLSGDEPAEDVERGRLALSDEPITRLFARRGTRIVPVPLQQISCVDACGDYARLRADGHEFVLNLTLTQLEQRLDPERFLRVHRSHIINLDRIAQMKPYDHRRLEVTLTDGTRVIASRAGSKRLRQMIG